MEYRKLGKTGVQLSEIALGGWLTYGGSEDLENSRNCVRTAIEAGVNFIDLADVYSGGNAEKVIGEIIKDYSRSDLVISSKVFFPMTDNINNRGLSRKHIMESIDGSLNRLDTDYLDIYYAHRFDRHTPLRETIQAMSDLIDQGKIHYWGTSCWLGVQLERVHWMAKDMGCHPPVVEQPQYNMLNRYVELDVLETAARNGMGITPFSPLSQGILTGKYNDGIPEGSRGDKTDWLQWDLTEENVEKVRKLVPIAEELDISMSQLALAWNLRRDEITSLITGATRVEHVESNVKASGIKLESVILDKIEEILGPAPAPHGIYNPPW